MFNLMEPGYILKFGTSPGTILSPMGDGNPDNTLETHWPTTSTLGLVQCISHPSGPIGAIAADVARNLRTTPGSISRSASYSAPGRLFTKSDRPIGSQNCDFVGYVDGQTNYIASNQTVFSKDFSGCLMVVYSVNGQRRVAHAAASNVPKMDCKQAFLTTLQNMNAVLHGWFKPYTNATGLDRKLATYDRIKKYVGQIDHLVTFGVVTTANQAYSITAFKPTTITGSDWVVTDVTPKVMSQSFVAN